MGAGPKGALDTQNGRRVSAAGAARGGPGWGGAKKKQDEAPRNVCADCRGWEAQRRGCHPPSSRSPAPACAVLQPGPAYFRGLIAWAMLPPARSSASHCSSPPPPQKMLPHPHAGLPHGGAHGQPVQESAAWRQLHDPGGKARGSAAGSGRGAATAAAAPAAAAAARRGGASSLRCALLPRRVDSGVRLSAVPPAVPVSSSRESVPSLRCWGWCGSGATSRRESRCR